MKKLCALLFGISWLATALAGGAADGKAGDDVPTMLQWPDLVKPFHFDDPFTRLTRAQLLDLTNIVRIRDFLARREKMSAARKARSAETAVARKAELDALEDKLISQGVDVDGLLAQREEIIRLRRARSEAVVEALDGQLVTLPGFVTPLEFDGEMVSKFLLVPSAGACIHVPPPPPNQIVMVTPEAPFKSKSFYHAVWVTGIIKVSKSTQPLNALDGSSDVSVGYSLEALKVEPYKFE